MFGAETNVGYIQDIIVHYLKLGLKLVAYMKELLM